MFLEQPIKNVEKPKINEKESFLFEEWGLKGRWLVIERGEQRIEGAMYNSDKPNGERPIFLRT